MLSVDPEARQFLPSQNILIKNSLKLGNVHYRQRVHYEVAITKRGKPRKLIGSVTLACSLACTDFSRPWMECPRQKPFEAGLTA